MSVERVGPAPAATDGPAVLSPQRALVLDLLRGVDGTATVGGIAELAGLHENTVREHLEGLLALRLVRRERSPAAGRGRPAWRYAARAVQQSTAVRDYLALASVLAGTIARTSADPASAATEAGAEWGRALVGDLPVEPDAATARHRVVELLADLGFAPEPDLDARTARLTRCPLLEVAREHPDVVCAVHRGIAEAALDALGAPDDARRVRLLPFAERGACLLHLGGPT
jgi:predicted ArsR family transcriptional regulator